MVKFFDRSRSSALHFDESNGSPAPPAFGAYRVLHQIGSGVLGPVFRTYDPQRDRLVAVKVFKLDIVPQDVVRLADALRKLVDPPLTDRAAIRVIDAGVEGMAAFAAMEFASGESLDVVLRQLAPSSLDRALPILAEIARAIDAGWQQGIGHGALHPRDVLLTPGSPDVRIAGFGFAAALESIGLKPVRRPHTAPERLAGQPWDIRADVYSLGVIAHELLTGRRPMSAGEQDGALAPDLSPEARVSVRRVLAAALSEQPASRFGSATAFLDELAAIAGHRAVVAGFGAAAGDPEEAGFSPPVPATPVLCPEDAEGAGFSPPAAATPVLCPEDGAGAGPESATPVFRPEDAGGVGLSPPESDRLKPVPPPNSAERPAPSVSRYPWLAIGAVALAGLAVGGVIGFQFGLGRSERVTVPVAAGSAKRGAGDPADQDRRGAGDPADQDRRGAGDPADQEKARADTEVPVLPEAPSPPPASGPASGERGSRPERPTTPAGAPSRVTAVSGRLTVRSVPSGALVTIDGRAYGETPATLRDLPLGVHTVQVARPGYVPRSHEVRLSRSTPSRTLDVDLKPGVDAQASQLGSIYLDSRPRGARALIDGRFVGTTPLLVPEVRAGDHTVRFELPGHLPAASTVGVKSGAQSRVTVTLVPGGK